MMVERVRPKEKVERVGPKEKVARVKPVEKLKLLHVTVESWVEEHRDSIAQYKDVPITEIGKYEDEARLLFRKTLKKHKVGMVLVFLIDNRGNYSKATGSLRGLNGRLFRAFGVFDDGEWRKPWPKEK